MNSGGDNKRILLPNDVLLGKVEQALKEGHTATINVRGYSMRPFLEHERDRVLLAPVGSLAVGDAVLARVGHGVFVLHRIDKMVGDRLTLMGDGNLGTVERCLMKDVVGVVKKYYRNGHEISADNRWLCRCVCLWRRLLPLRRGLLLFYRAKIKFIKLLNHED